MDIVFSPYFIFDVEIELIFICGKIINLVAVLISKGPEPCLEPIPNASNEPGRMLYGRTTHFK